MFNDACIASADVNKICWSVKCSSERRHDETGVDDGSRLKTFSYTVSVPPVDRPPKTNDVIRRSINDPPSLTTAILKFGLYPSFGYK